MSIKNKFLSLPIILLCLNLSGCSDTNEKAQLNTPVATKITIQKNVPEDNKKEIEIITRQLEAILAQNEKSKEEVNRRLKTIENKVENIILKVERNTSMYKQLKGEVELQTDKITSYFKRKLSSKSNSKKLKRKVATKSEYKIIAIDRWGSFKYVQLLDSKGKLWLLREGEKINNWKVRDVKDDGVILMNSKGHQLALRLAS